MLHDLVVPVHYYCYCNDTSKLIQNYIIHHNYIKWLPLVPMYNRQLNKVYVKCCKDFAVKWEANVIFVNVQAYKSQACISMHNSLWGIIQLLNLAMHMLQIFYSLPVLTLPNGTFLTNRWQPTSAIENHLERQFNQEIQYDNNTSVSLSMCVKWWNVILEPSNQKCTHIITMACLVCNTLARKQTKQWVHTVVTDVYAMSNVIGCVRHLIEVCMMWNDFPINGVLPIQY